MWKLLIATVYMGVNSKWHLCLSTTTNAVRLWLGIWQSCENSEKVRMLSSKTQDVTVTCFWRVPIVGPPTKKQANWHGISLYTKQFIFISVKLNLIYKAGSRCHPNDTELLVVNHDRATTLLEFATYVSCSTDRYSSVPPYSHIQQTVNILTINFLVVGTV